MIIHVQHYCISGIHPPRRLWFSLCPCVGWLFCQQDCTKTTDFHETLLEDGSRPRIEETIGKRTHPGFFFLTLLIIPQGIMHGSWCRLMQKWFHFFNILLFHSMTSLLLFTVWSDMCKIGMIYFFSAQSWLVNKLDINWWKVLTTLLAALEMGDDSFSSRQLKWLNSWCVKCRWSQTQWN